MNNIQVIARLYNPVLKIKEHKFILSANKVAFWQNKSTLLLTDLHLGKNLKSNYIDIHTYIERLSKSIDEFNPKRIILLGDLFDAKSNIDHSPLKDFLSSVNIPTTLVLGNHDILNLEVYKNLGIENIVDNFIEDMFIFTHKPYKFEDKDSRLVNIHGHLHPGYTIKNQKLACFHIKNNYLCLPAFGGTTGKSLVTPTKDSKVYCVNNEEVNLLNN